MASKFSPIKSAMDYIKILRVIIVTVGIMAIKLSGDFLAFSAFIVSVISVVVSAAITSDAAMRRDIGKRLECFYKPSPSQNLKFASLALYFE